jgi:hypothetical protein
MSAILTVTRLPLDATSMGILKNHVDSAGFKILKEVVASYAAENAAEAANWLAAGGDEASKSRASMAAVYRECVELLDELQEKPQMWSTIKIEPRR